MSGRGEEEQSLARLPERNFAVSAGYNSFKMESLWIVPEWNWQPTISLSGKTEYQFCIIIKINIHLLTVIMAQTRLLQAENIENKILTQGKLLVPQTKNPLCRSLQTQADRYDPLVCMCVCMYVCMHAYRTEDRFSHCSSGTVPFVSHWSGAGPADQAGWAGSPRDLCVSASPAVNLRAGRSTSAPFKNMVQIRFWGWNLGPLALRTYTLSSSQTGLIQFASVLP